MNNLELRIQELEETERRNRNKIHSLNRTVRQKDAALEELRKEKLALIRLAYRYLGDLAWTLLTARSAEAVFGRARELLKEIDCGTKERKRLTVFLERHLDFRPADLRGLKEDEIILLRYLVVGYKPALISLLTGIEAKRLYSKKRRMVKRLAKYARSRRYLDLLP